MIPHRTVLFLMFTALAACGGAATPDAGLDASTTPDAPAADSSMDACVGTATDPRNCGATSCTVCSAPANATATCTAGTCGFTCGSGFHLCSGTCADNTSPLTCGTMCTPCAMAPANGTATCTAGTCGFTCNAGYFVSGSSCSIAPPRQIAPLSTATATSLRPTLRWSLATGADGAHVELCRDRALSAGCVSFMATGSSGRPAAPLAPGLWFWRLEGTISGATGTATSQTWEFFVGHVSAAVDTSWGTTLDVNGDGFADVVVGAPFSDSAYVYLGGGAGLATTAATTLTGPAGSNFGISVASAGDVDGDGFADVVVGAGRLQTAYLYLGSGTGLATTAATTLTGPAGSTFGQSVASAGDVNGDGYADVVVGGNTGFVYLGSGGGLATTAATTLGSPTGSYPVASAGDVNGDGYADIVAGGPGSPYAYLYLGSAAGVAAAAATMLLSPAGPVGVDNSVASAGDVNGDGYADVVVGAHNADSAYVYLGSGTGLMATVATTATGPAGSGFGNSVASAGDVDGDGFADVIVGADNPGDSAYVFLGSSAGLAATAATTLTGPAGPAGFGHSVASAGDIDGDGFADVVVGTYTFNTAYVYLGSAAGLATAAAATLTGTGFSSGFGSSVASAGDVNAECTGSSVPAMLELPSEQRT